VEVSVAIERVQFLDADGRLITESLTDYTRKTLHKSFATLDDFLTRWNAADQKKALIEELAAQGLFLDELADQVGRKRCTGVPLNDTVNSDGIV
jgi:type I restriction enzyme R subunit